MIFEGIPRTTARGMGDSPHAPLFHNLQGKDLWGKHSPAKLSLLLWFATCTPAESGVSRQPS